MLQLALTSEVYWFINWDLLSLSTLGWLDFGHLCFDEPIDEQALTCFDVLWRNLTSDELLTGCWRAMMNSKKNVVRLTIGLITVRIGARMVEHASTAGATRREFPESSKLKQQYILYENALMSDELLTSYWPTTDEQWRTVTNSKKNNIAHEFCKEHTHFLPYRKQSFR